MSRKASAFSGGSINQTFVVSFASGARFFVKTHRQPQPRMFACEAAGLQALGEAGAIRVPQVVAQDQGFLVLELIEPGAPREFFFRRFGEQLATLHRQSRSTRCGFEHDNYIGSTEQKNPWTDDWVTFFRDQRLGFQLALAKTNGVSSRELEQLGDKLLDQLESLIGEPTEPPCLLHGDLWSGNYLCGKDSQPVLIDPAVYYGRREAELAMTQLFGGFDRQFYEAYEATWPLADGADERIELYKLYHLLNHLNLFGGSYLGSCLSTMRRFV
jgi:protein-ribulosamine 3-kinase